MPRPSYCHSTDDRNTSSAVETGQSEHQAIANHYLEHFNCLPHNLLASGLRHFEVANVLKKESTYDDHETQVAVILDHPLYTGHLWDCLKFLD